MTAPATTDLAHVLVVDDEPHVGRIIQMKLEQGPFRVTVAYVIALAVASAWLIWGPDTRQLWLDALIAELDARPAEDSP